MSDKSDSDMQPFILDDVSDPKEYLRRGTDLESLEDFVGAIEFFSLAIAEYPNPEFAYDHRALCYTQIDALQEAISDYSVLIDIDSSDGFAFLNRATIFYDMEQYQDAWDDLELAVSLIPQQPMVHHLRGDLNQIGGQLDQSVRSYERALYLDPDFDTARHNRMIAYRDSKMWWIFDNRGIYLGNLNRDRKGSYSGQITRDSINQYFDDLVSIFSKVGTSRVDQANSVIFPDIELEDAVDAIVAAGLVLTVDRDGPPWNWIAWLDSLESSE